MQQRSHRRPSQPRRLFLQALEKRHLLAADWGVPPLWDAIPGQAETFASAETSVSGQSNGGFVATDAGGTRDTAARLGSIDGARQLNGSLSWFDLVDAVQFTLDREAQVQIDLTDLGQNADLYLYDAQGRQLVSSTNRGRMNEAISANLPAGDYYFSVNATSFRSTNYRVTITAQLVPLDDPAEGVSGDSGDGSDTGGGVANPVEPLPDVPYYGGSREWNVNAVDAPEAWAAGYTGQGITVAIVDTGVDWNHPDLVQNIFVNPNEVAGNGIDDDGNGYIDDVRGYDFVSGDANPDDGNGHGTHVAGTVAAARNGFGATGIAPDAKILPVRVLNNSGSGSSFDVAAGIRYAADLGAQVINLSLGGGYSSVIDAAIDYARSLGSLIVAAAGNEGASRPGYPARFSASDSNVISVGAYNSSGVLAGFSNRVGNSEAVQVDAPGVGVYSTFRDGRYATLSGTSMASPHVAGLAALTLSANPNLTTPELRDLLATGTVGLSAGSDSLGSASASTSVAYAAAGLTSGPGAVNVSPQTTGSWRNLFGNWVRTTGLPTPPLASPLPGFGTFQWTLGSFTDSALPELQHSASLTVTKLRQTASVADRRTSAYSPSAAEIYFSTWGDRAASTDTEAVESAASRINLDAILTDLAVLSNHGPVEHHHETVNG